jgi:hypothetical protein
MAARFSRVLLGTVAVFLAALIGNLSTLWNDEPRFARALAEPFGLALAEAAGGITALSPERFLSAVVTIAALPGRLALARPVDTLVLGLPMVLVFALFGGTISRGVASEFATARLTDWPADLRISITKLGWSFGALVVPVALAGLLLGVIALGGSMLGVPVLNVLAALLYALGLILGLTALVVLALHALALPMIVPAMMCEGTDGYDAVQRSYAYVLARPLRLLLHAAILLVLGAISIAVVATLARLTVATTDWAASALTGDAGVRVLEGSDDLAATQPAAHAVINAWRALVFVTVSGFAFSYFFTAGTLLYLVARRICDGQGTSEIWDPSETE